ncbi:hypothetical protein [Nesterenkonia muleiensis]|uniref:hypothetical protein n=1 Tax=Nesterenkonia muleiensis TaxID=2282648 RepID=UPI000E7228E9|nr:hypothetical protein [Nesterenkonia muleiensis]
MTANAPVPHRTSRLQRLLTLLVTTLLLISASAVAAGPVHAQQIADALGSDAVLTGPEEVEYGEAIQISGTGFLTSDGEPSVMTVLLDARFSGDPDTVYTTRDVLNPVTVESDGDKRLHAVVEAAADGSWEATIPFPTAENSTAGAGTPAWTPGSSHEIRVLTGSYRTGDQIRSMPLEFTISGGDGQQPGEGPDPDESPEPSDPAQTPEPGETPQPGAPEWPHVTVTHGSGAVAHIERDVGLAEGETLRIRGQGWTNQERTSGSTIAIKLNSSQTAQYTRDGNDVVVHPSAGGDDTIWALLAPQNPEDHQYVFEIDDDGSFDIELPAPEVLSAGQYLSVLFQSGLFQPGDVTRAVTSEPLVVGGVPFADETGLEAEVTCVPSAGQPTVEIENPAAGFGEELIVHGRGWCHPEDDRGASVLAIKIDEGAYSRLDDSLHQNRTIWYIVNDADPATGDWTARIDLPDGTAATSDPALPEGAHTLRLLTGSLKPGDAPRTVLSEEFVIGQYQPLGPPEPPEYGQDLTEDAQGPVSITQSARYIDVTIPGAQDGDWIYLMGFAEDGSPRTWWGGTWFQVEDQRVRAPLAETVMPLPEEPTKLAVLSGNQGEAGLLLGWKWIHGSSVQGPPDSAPSGDGAPTRSDESSTGSSQPRNQVRSTTDSSPGRQPGTGYGETQHYGIVQSPLQNLGQPLAQQTSWHQAPGEWVQEQWAPELEQQPGAPTADPAPPHEEDLTEETAGELTVWLEDQELVLQFPGADSGDWLFLHLFPGAQPLGWIEVDDEHQVRIDVTGMPPGEFRFSVQDREGELIGWAELIHEEHQETGTEQTAGSVLSPPETDDQPGQQQQAPAVSSGGLLGHSDWVLISLGAGALFGVALAMFLTGRRIQTA